MARREIPRQARRQGSPSDLTDAQWELVEPLLPGIWKPAPAIYRASADKLHTRSIAWHWSPSTPGTCHGAKRAGALAGWCARLEGEPGDVFTPR